MEKRQVILNHINMREFELLRKIERVEQIQKNMQDTLVALQVSYNEDSFAQVNSEISRIKDILKKKISGGFVHTHTVPEAEFKTSNRLKIG